MNSFGRIIEILLLLGERCQGSLIDTRYSSNLDPPQNLSGIKKSLAENTYGPSYGDF